MSTRSTGDAVQDIKDEAIEFVKEPSMDELSDMLFGIGRLLGGLIGRVYVHVPGDARHIAKIDRRMAEYSCVRSKKHAVQH